MVEITYAERLMTIAAHSSCSARLAVRQVHTTRAKPAAAASRRATPRMYPAMLASEGEPGPASAPNRTRRACQATAALCGHCRGGEIAVLGAIIWYAPKCSMSARTTAASGTDATAARAFAASPVRIFRAATTRYTHTTTIAGTAT